MLRVATFNIRHGLANDGPDSWVHRGPRAIEMIRQLDADVLGLQEVLEFQLAEILSGLPRYLSIGVGRSDGIRQGEFNPILYDPSILDSRDEGTFWLSDSPALPGSASWGNENVRICTWARFRLVDSGHGFAMFNTHLDHASPVSRSKSIALVLDRMIRETDPIILTGDFNVDECDVVIDHVRAGGLVDTFRVANPKAADADTFHGFRETLEPGKIDYVFVSPGWRVESAEIVRTKIDGRWPSDHLPVVTTVEIPRPHRCTHRA